MIQIFGTLKCRDSRKAQRFFKERGIKIQFIDLRETAVSRGELNSIRASVPLEELIDVDGREYEALNLKYLQHDVEEMLLEHPLLFRTPIVRSGRRAVVGDDPTAWKAFADELK